MAGKSEGLAVVLSTFQSHALTANITENSIGTCCLQPVPVINQDKTSLVEKFQFHICHIDQGMESVVGNNMRQNTGIYKAENRIHCHYLLKLSSIRQREEQSCLLSVCS